MAGLLTGLGPMGAALALLGLGHVLADFAFQSRRMVEHKDRPGPLLAHGAVVLLVHGLALLPMLTLEVVFLLIGIAVSHVITDGVKASLQEPQNPSLGAFTLDQGIHGVVLLGAWALFPHGAWDQAPFALAIGGVAPEVWTWATIGAVYVAAFVFAHHGCNAIVQTLLPEDELNGGDQGLEAGGRKIGTLERWIILLLGLAGAWDAVALVIGAKAVARFEELKNRAFAEYFLIGTLASVTLALALVLIIQAVL